MKLRRIGGMGAYCFLELLTKFCLANLSEITRRNKIDLGIETVKSPLIQVLESVSIDNLNTDLIVLTDDLTDDPVRENLNQIANVRKAQRFHLDDIENIEEIFEKAFTFIDDWRLFKETLYFLISCESNTLSIFFRKVVENRYEGLNMKYLVITSEPDDIRMLEEFVSDELNMIVTLFTRSVDSENNQDDIDLSKQFFVKCFTASKRIQEKDTSYRLQFRGTWTNFGERCKGLSIFRQSIRNFKRMKGQVLKVATMQSLLGIIGQKELPDGRLVLNELGIESQILLTAFKSLNFSMEVIKTENYGGIPLPNGTWNGFVGDLINKRADIAAGTLSLTIERYHAVECGRFYTVDPIYLLSRKPGLKSMAFIQLKPFQGEAWLCIILSVLVVSFLLTVLDRFGVYYVQCSEKPSRGDFLFSVNYCIFYVFSTMITQVSSQEPKTHSVRYLIVFWGFFSLIIVNGYSGKVRSFLIFPAYEEPMDNLGQLVRGILNKEWTWTSIKNSAASSIFGSTSSGYFKVMWDQVKDKWEKVAVPFSDVSKAAQRPKTAVAVPMFFARLSLSSNPTLYIGKEGFVNRIPVLLFRTGSTIRPAIDQCVSRMFEGGLIVKWTSDIERNFAAKITPQKKDKILPLKAFQGAFYILFIGSAMSMILLTCELVGSRKKRRKETFGSILAKRQK